jgi:integrase
MPPSCESEYEEALALRWQDVRALTLNIEATYAAGELKPRTKTPRARSVPIIEPLRADLDVAESLRLPDSFVVPNRYGDPSTCATGAHGSGTRPRAMRA